MIVLSDVLRIAIDQWANQDWVFDKFSMVVQNNRFRTKSDLRIPQVTTMIFKDIEVKNDEITIIHFCVSFNNF